MNSFEHSDMSSTVVTGISSQTPPITFEATSSNFWFALAKWSREGNHFNSFVRRFIYNIGVYKSSGKDLSEKQTVWARKILEDSTALGFVHLDAVADK